MLVAMPAVLVTVVSVSEKLSVSSTSVSPATFMVTVAELAPAAMLPEKPVGALPPI